MALCATKENMQKFIDKYLELNLKDYENFGFDLEITKLLGFVFLGIMIAAVAMNLINRSTHLVIKALIRHECTSEDKAKTLPELRITSPLAAHVAFTDSGRLHKVIKRVGEKEYSYEEYVQMQKEKKKPEKLDSKTTPLYIPEGKLDEAKSIFDKGAPTVLDSVLVCILLLALYVCLTFVMPTIVSLINSMM